VARARRLPPPPPDRVIVSHQHGHNAELGQQRPPSNCTVTGYTIYKNGTQVGTSTTTLQRHRVDTFDYVQLYGIAASDSAGMSPQSSPVSVTTGSAGTPKRNYTITSPELTRTSSHTPRR